LVLDQIRECQPTDIFPQRVVQKFDAMKSKFLVMHLKIDSPRLVTAAYRKIVVERRVEDSDSFCFVPSQNTSQTRD
jgi:hypothetical protein